jgi:hypothetical protein
MTNTIERMVYQALDNARENGYDQRFLTPEDIAHDLTDCDADLGGAHVNDLLPHIASWMAERFGKVIPKS